MPAGSIRNMIVDALCNGQENTFHTIIKGVQHSCERCQFDGIRLMLVHSIKQRSIGCEELFNLCHLGTNELN